MEIRNIDLAVMFRRSKKLFFNLVGLRNMKMLLLNPDKLPRPVAPGIVEGILDTPAPRASSLVRNRKGFQARLDTRERITHDAAAR